MKVDFADCSVAPRVGLELSRNLQNGGTMNINCGQIGDAFSIMAGGSLVNDGNLYLTSSSGSFVNLDCGDLFKNNMNTIVNGGGDASLVGSNPAIEMTNYGSIQVTSGSLTITGPFGNYGGVLSAAGGTNVNYGAGVFTFCGGSMQGAGSFNLTSGDGNIVAAEDTTASNFYMSAGTLNGPADFSAEYFAWSGGTMSENGITTVAAGARMDISNSVTLDTRTIRDQGLITWAYAEAEATIEMANSAKIDVNGGAFQTYNVSGNISTDGTDCKIVVSNNGSFFRNSTEVPGTVTIGARFENHDGQVNIQGDTNFTTFHQDGANAKSVFGSGSYQFAPGPAFVGIDGGDFELDGGTINANLGLRNANFVGNGSITLLLATQSNVTLNGSLSVSACAFSNQTTANLGGFTLSASSSVTNNAGCTINSNC